MTLNIKTVQISDLHPGLGNPKLHDIPTIKDSLTRYGLYKPIVVNLGTETERPMEVLAGNGTVVAAQELGWEEIEINLIDVGEVHAKKIMAMDNRSHDLGGYDEEALGELLKEIVTIDELAGTGYTEADLLKLLGTQSVQGDASVEDNMVYAFGVVIECADEDEQRAVLQEQIDLGRTVRALI